MSLLAFAIAGSVVALLMMIVGFVWLGRRREFEVSRMSPEEAAQFVGKGWRGHPAIVWFRGLAAGLSFSAEKPTKEIVALILAGRWSEGLPWAIPALGAMAAFFFWPLLVGVLAGMDGVFLWGMALVFFAGGLIAAWPRDEDEEA
jgi:hypothetical protein